MLLESCSDIRELRALSYKQYLNCNSDVSRVCFCLISISAGSKPVSAVGSKKILWTSSREDRAFNAWSTHPLTLRHIDLFLVLQIIRQHLNQPSRGGLLHAAGLVSSSWNQEILWRDRRTEGTGPLSIPTLIRRFAKEYRIQLQVSQLRHCLRILDPIVRDDVELQSQLLPLTTELQMASDYCGAQSHRPCSE